MELKQAANSDLVLKSNDIMARRIHTERERAHEKTVNRILNQRPRLRHPVLN